MTKSTRVSILIVILIIATFLRFHHFASTPPGLYPDEAIDGNNAVEVAETGHFQSFYIEDNGREGLYVNIIALLYKAFPHDEPWLIRLPAAIAGVLTVWGVYLLTAELFGASTGLLAAFLIATNFWHINFSRIGFRAILAPLLLVWAFYFFIRSLREESNKKKAFAYATLAGIIYSLGFYTYIAYRITPLLFLLFIPFFKRSQNFWKKTAVFIIITFIVAAPIGWYFAQHPADFFGRTSEISVTNSGNPVGTLAMNIFKTALMFNFRGDENWRHNVSGAPELFWPVGILFLAGIFFGIRAIRKNVREKNMPALFANSLVFLWFVLALLPEAASNEGIPHALRSILAIPPVMIIAAQGGVRIFEFMKNAGKKYSARIVACLFFVAVAGFAYYDYFIVWAQNPNVPGAFNADYVAIGRAINALPVTMPKYVIVSAGGVTIRGIPTPAETTMFITHSFTASDAAARNIRYLLPNEIASIPSGTASSSIFFIK